MLLRRVRVGFVLLVVSCNSGGGGGAAADGGKPSPKDAAPLNCGDAGAGTSFPCDVAPIIESKCQRCHNTADVLSTCEANKSCERGPFPLLTWSDTRRQFGTGMRVVDYLPEVIERKIMPLTSADVQPPVEPLTDDEQKTMVAWVRSCAPAAAAACP
jgi:hypothetical protein